MKSPVLLTVLGPTASGKTDLSITLAEKFNGEIISADSRQFYKEMEIGTAKPSIDNLASATHHFISFISIKNPINAAEFEYLALNIIGQINRKGKLPILTGGSGLYVDAILKGFDQIPDSDQATRKILNDELTMYGIEYLSEKLKNLDQQSYLSIDIKNPRRVIRALEVCLTSGKKFSSFKKTKQAERPFSALKIGIEISKEELYQRINLRCDQMIADGLLDEVKKLYPLKEYSALNTIGYFEFFQYMEENYSKEEAIEKFKQHSRNYAKRQQTWLRKDQQINWFKRGEEARIFSFLEEKLK